MFFSRYLFSRDFRLPKLRNQQGTNAPVVAANPAGLNEKFVPIAANAIIDVARCDEPTQSSHFACRSTSATWNCPLIWLRRTPLIFFIWRHGLAAGEAIYGLRMNREMRRGLQEKLLHTVLLDWKNHRRWLCSVHVWGAGSGSGRKWCFDGSRPLLASKGIPAVLAMQGNFLLKHSGKIYADILFSQETRWGWSGCGVCSRWNY